LSTLEDMPNIGKVLADRLRQAGIATEAELMMLGDAQAFLRVRADLPEDACTHTRLALAGAVRGVRWHSLDKDLRERLATEAKSGHNKSGG
jgi:DNA transformation protein and related proteins